VRIVSELEMKLASPYTSKGVKWHEPVSGSVTTSYTPSPKMKSPTFPSPGAENVGFPKFAQGKDATGTLLHFGGAYLNMIGSYGVAPCWLDNCSLLSLQSCR